MSATHELVRGNGLIGQSVTRLEDLPLVLGQGQYANDIAFPNQLHMRMVRSPVAHGRIVRVDATQALELPGVVAVWAHADIAGFPPIQLREGTDKQLDPYLQHILAKDRVRYVGEPLAAVFAEDAYVAEDAAELVHIEIEELPALLDAAAVPGEFASGLMSEPLVLRKGFGDVDAAFAAAHAVIELDLKIGRHSGVPLECRGAVARYDVFRDVVEMYGAAKVPHRTRDGIAKILGRPTQGVHLYESHVGGGFGVRGELYPEDALVCLAALRLRRPVKWIEDRYENLIACNHSRQQTHHVRAAVDRDGRLLAIDDVFYHDQGAYVRTHGARPADMTAGMLPAQYHVAAYRVAGHYRLTNKTPAATYRSPGRYESTFVRERLMDAIAARLGIDRIEIRRRNLIPKSAMPYARALSALGDSVEFDSGDYALLLDKCLTKIGWAELQADIARRRAKGEAVGVGIAIFLEKSGLGPRDGAHVSVDASGAVEVVTGGASVGQGFETVMAQVCGDALGVDYRKVRVVHGRTDRIAHGIGAHAARATVMTGSAVHVATLKTRAKALEMAAAMLAVPEDELDIANGEIFRKGSADRIGVSLADVAKALEPTSKTLGVREPGLTALGWFSSDHMNYPYGVHIAVVNVERATGVVKVERYLLGYDIGRAINPMLIDGQLVGGFAQGLGGALYEEFLYDESGQPLSVTLADYLIPTAHEVPPVETLVTEDAPSPLNPLGLKGAGEGGITGVGACIASAVDDALGIPGAVTQIPVTPQRVREILRGHADRARST